MLRFFDMGVNPISRKGDDTMSCSCRLSGQWSLQLGGYESLRVARSRRQQCAAPLVEIDQGEHGLCPRQVLGQTSVAHLGEAPELLEHPKRMLAAGAGARTHPIDQPPMLTQRFAIRAPIDPVAHTLRGEGLAVGFFPIGLIAKYLPFLSVEQMWQLGDVCHPCVGRDQAIAIRR